MYHLLDHTADLAIEVTADTRADLYSEAAAALVDIVLGPLKNGLPADKKTELQVEGLDAADLLVNWLREILALINVEGRVPFGITITRSAETSLAAELELIPLDQAGDMQSEVKAVTYHQVSVEQSGDIWRARVVFDT